MKAKIVTGQALAVAAVSLALAGAASAVEQAGSSKDEQKREQPAAEKHSCAGPNGCGGKMAPASDSKSGDAKDAGAK